QTQQFTATGTYSDASTKNITASVTWTSSNTGVGTVGATTGLATGVSAGTTQITATLGAVVSPADTLTVNAITLQSIATTPSNPSIFQSQTQQFTATGNYNDGSSKNITTSVAWASSNPTVATVDAALGLATGVSPGTTQITATQGTVVSPGSTLTANSPLNPSISPAQTQQFIATGTYNDGSTKDITTTVTWASSSATIATIGANTGLATGVAAGISQITATLGAIVSLADPLTVSTGPVNSYTTNFSLTENPISEAGKWINGKATGLDWADVRTTPGLAFGAQTATAINDDSTAVLTGTWGPDQTAQATVFTINQNSTIFEEVELRLRTSISAQVKVIQG
ncbi:MAG: ATP-dependent DNA ligase, partial [Acidobacteria bacterium]